MPIPQGPPAEPVDDASLHGRVKRVHRAWGLLLLALSLISLGVRGYLLKQLEDTVLTVWQVLWLTLPMTAAVAIFAYMAFTKKKFSFATVVATIIGTLVASWLIGLTGGEQVAQELWHVDSACAARGSCETISGGAPGLALRIVGAYFQVYGAVGFFSAVAVGVFLGYALAVLGVQQTSGHENA
jgi:hypothetical protein